MPANTTVAEAFAYRAGELQHFDTMEIQGFIEEQIVSVCDYEGEQFTREQRNELAADISQSLCDMDLTDLVLAFKRVKSNFYYNDPDVKIFGKLSPRKMMACIRKVYDDAANHLREVKRLKELSDKLNIEPEPVNLVAGEVIKQFNDEQLRKRVMADDKKETRIIPMHQINSPLKVPQPVYTPELMERRRFFEELDRKAFMEHLKENDPDEYQRQLKQQSA